MDEILRPFTNFRELSQESLVHVLDVMLVGYLIYRLLALIRGTRAWRIVSGLFIFLLLLFLSKRLGLDTLHWVLDKATILGPVALAILLLPELRQALEGFGKLGTWSSRIAGVDVKAEAREIEEIVAAATELAAARTGAIIVIEKGVPLTEIIENGVAADAKVSAPMLGAIFYEGNPLHDGAAIIRGDRVVAAACRLPLSDSTRLAPNLHMRHRAAVGITEQRDCIAVVVSEERGTISFVSEGQLSRVSPHELREALNRELRSQPEPKIKERNGLFGRRQDRSSSPKPEDPKKEENVGPPLV